MTINNYTFKNSDDFGKLNWLKPILNNHAGFIAGGFAKSIFDERRVKDVDIFFKNKRDFEVAAEYFLCDDTSKKEYATDNVMAFKTDTGLVLELNKKIFGEPLDIIRQFDFTISKFAMYRYEDIYKVVYHHDFFEHLFLRRLVVDDKLDYPVSTFERALRYTKYGFSMCRNTKEKLIKAIHDFPIENENISKSLYDGID